MTFIAKKITDRVKWVGKIDWRLEFFHGKELSTKKGSSYNSYLIEDEKVALVDTVWLPFAREFVDNLAEVIDLERIDYIVMNHNEIDHSGALPLLMSKIPDTPIYCTKKGEMILRGMYKEDWNYINVKTGDELDLGKTKLRFIEAPMLHWPDTMFSYLTEENILFSTDAFGQHYATEDLFDEHADLAEVFPEMLKYYTNILAPYSPMVLRKMKEIGEMQLPLSMVCPSHGIIWREHMMDVFATYMLWADNYSEDRVVIIYDTMWNSTGKMAEYIAEGIRRGSPGTKVVLCNASERDKNDIAVEAFRAGTILFGSPTINNGYSYAIAGMLELIKGLRLKKKKAAAFGSYGWSGEAVKLLNKELAAAGFTVIGEGLRSMWRPDKDECIKYGEELLADVKE